MSGRAMTWDFRGNRFYSGIIILLAALAMVATLPGRTHGLGMVTERLLNDPSFNITRVQYGTMNMWTTLLGGLFCLPCGWLIDRFGLKWTLLGTVAGLIGTVFWMTKLSGAPALFVAILLTRGFGQSALSIVSITMVGKWFRGNVTLPMAIYSMLGGIGFAWSMTQAGHFKDDDWRVLWGGIGWCLVGFTCLAAVLLRDPPRVEVVSETCEPDAEIGFTLSQALLTPAFWLFSISISLIGLIGAGTSLFNESILKQQGFETQVYYDVLSFTFLVGLAAKVPVGLAGRFVKLNYLQGIGLALLGACLLWLPSIRSLGLLKLYAVGMGISGTITTVVFFTIWTQAYGRKHLGEIQSIAQMGTVLASAIGPKLYAEVFEASGSYAPVFRWLAIVVLVLSAVSLIIRVPSPEEAGDLAVANPPLPAGTELTVT